MLERLGNVIYWLGCALSALVVILAGYLLTAGGLRGSEYIFILVLMGVAVVVWAIGWAIRYILVGR
jgi:hypothetical protein